MSFPAPLVKLGVAAAFGIGFVALSGCSTAQTVETSVAPTPTFVPSPPTSTPINTKPTPEPSPTAEPTPVRFRMSNLDGTPVPTPTGVPATRTPIDDDAIPLIPTAGPTLSAGTVTPAPIPTAAPTSTPAAPTPTPRPRPIPTATPAPPSQPVNQPQRVEVGCTISDHGPIQVGQTITLRATQSPANVPLGYRFDHGDGTVDPQAVSQAVYHSPGRYAVTLHWRINGTQGQIPCGTVTVVAASAPAPQTQPGFSAAHYIGLAEFGAVDRAAGQGFTMVRVLRRDQVVYPAGGAYNSTRLNLETDNGLVTRAYVG